MCSQTVLSGDESPRSSERLLLHSHICYWTLSLGCKSLVRYKHRITQVHIRRSKGSVLKRLVWKVLNFKLYENCLTYLWREHNQTSIGFRLDFALCLVIMGRKELLLAFLSGCCHYHHHYNSSWYARKNKVSNFLLEEITWQIYHFALHKQITSSQSASMLFSVLPRKECSVPAGTDGKLRHL